MVYEMGPRIVLHRERGVGATVANKGKSTMTSMNAAMKKKNLLRRKKSRGQGMTEYIIIVSLVAVAAIGIITLFGDNIRALFGQSARALAGEQNLNNNGRQGDQQQLRQKNLNNAFQNEF